MSFRNAGTMTCTLYGYPGVALLDGAGHEVAQAQRTPSGFIGGMKTGSSTPPTAILAPGQTGTAVIEGIDVVGINGTTSCPTYSGIMVTPPTTTESMHFPLSVVGCLAVQVHPVIATTRSTITPGATVSHPTVTRLTVVGMTVPEAAAIALSTGRHLEVQLTQEQVAGSMVPDTVVSQGAPSGSLNPSPTSPVVVDVTVAVPPAPPCRATQVAMAFDGGQGFTGNDSGFLVVRDISPQWCSLTGPVEVWGQAGTGRVATDTLTLPVPAPVVMSPLTVTPEPFFPDASGAVQASVGFAASENTCTPTARIVPRTMDLSVPGITLKTSNQTYTKDGIPHFVACSGRFLTQEMPTPVTARG